MPIPGRSPARAVLVASAVAAVVGLLAMMLMLWQPWASCPEVMDDGTAGCPVQGTQLTLQTMTFLFLGASLIGVVVSGAAVMMRGQRTH